MNSVKVLHLFYFFVSLNFVIRSGTCSYPYAHEIVWYTCEDDSVLYRFNSSLITTPQLKGNDAKLLKIERSKITSYDYEVIIMKSSNLESIYFEIDHIHIHTEVPDLTIQVEVEVRECEEYFSHKGTIIISVLASVCLLLFAALSLSLIILNEKKATCLQKILCFSKKDDSPKSILDPGFRFEEFKPPTFGSELSSEPMPSFGPRKSSLKPTRAEAFPIPSTPPIETDGTFKHLVIDENKLRRKSMVTFNERTEIRI